MASGHRTSPTLLNTEEAKDAWKAGYDAGRQQLDETDCPFQRTTLRAAWTSGRAKGVTDAVNDSIEWSDDPADPDYHPAADPFVRGKLAFKCLDIGCDYVQIRCDQCDRSFATVNRHEYATSGYVRTLIELHAHAYHRNLPDKTTKPVDWLKP